MTARQLPPAGSWVTDAACKGMTATFFPEPIGGCRGRGRGKSGPLTDPRVLAAYERAAKVCAGCPVRADCLAYALTLPRAHMQGMYAGLRPGQLEDLRFPRRNRRSTAA